MMPMNDDYPNVNYYLVVNLIILLESDINNHHHTVNDVCNVVSLFVRIFNFVLLLDRTL